MKGRQKMAGELGGPNSASAAVRIGSKLGRALSHILVIYFCKTAAGQPYI